MRIVHGLRGGTSRRHWVLGRNEHGAPPSLVPVLIPRRNAVSSRQASIVAAAVASLLVAATPAHAAAGARSYVVELKAAPLASYTGDRRGLAATSPLSTGARRLNTRSAAARAY